MTIDRTSPMPLYYQLKQILLSKIESRELKSGDIFPTEQQIQDTYEVSRTTVRQALSELEDEGRITRHRGRGTFVSKPKVAHSPENYPNLADNMTQQGAIAGWKLLSAEWLLPPQEVYEALGVAHNQKVFQLERLRLESTDPIGYHRAYVSPEFIMGIDGTAYTEGGSLRYLNGLSILEDCIAHRTVEAVPANEKIAELLNIEIDSATLRVKRIVFSPDDTPIEFFIGIYRGDRFEYHIHNMRAVSGINA